MPLADYGAEIDASLPLQKIIRINGSLFFGAVHYFEEKLHQICEPNVLIVSIGINFMAIAGAEMLAHEDNRHRKPGERLYFYKMKPKPKQILESSDHIDSIETDAFSSSKATALKEMQQTLSERRCENCQQRIFTECLDLYGQSSC